MPEVCDAFGRLDVKSGEGLPGGGERESDGEKKSKTGCREWFDEKGVNLSRVRR